MREAVIKSYLSLTDVTNHKNIDFGGPIPKLSKTRIFVGSPKTSFFDVVTSSLMKNYNFITS